jgi:hypothetical protein
MKRLLIQIVALGCVTMTGCFTQKKEEATTTTSTTLTTKKTGASERVIVTGSNVPTIDRNEFPRVAKRSYLYVDLKSTPNGYGAYAYLVFTHKPSSENVRDVAVCRAFNRDFPPVEASPSIPKRRSEMVTFWPLEGSYLGDQPNCEQLLMAYADGWGAAIASSVHKQGAKGPLLIAWTKPFSDDRPAGDALVLDMSDFATKDFDRAFGIWRDQISMNPAVWQKNWNLVLIRESCRNGLEKYGPTIATVVSNAFSVGKKPE